MLSKREIVGALLESPLYLRMPLAARREVMRRLEGNDPGRDRGRTPTLLGLLYRPAGAGVLPGADCLVQFTH